MRLPIVSETLVVSPFFSFDWFGDSLAVPPEWCTLGVALPVAKILDHPERTAMNSEMAGTFENEDEVNQLKLINTIQSVGRLGIEANSLKRGDLLDSTFVEIFSHDSDNVVIPAKLNHSVESRGNHLMLVQPKVPKQEVKRGF